MTAEPVLVVLTNLPNREAGLALARALVERRLAACVNVLGECASVYRWKGEMETAAETPLVIKAPASRYDELERAIRELHPYELPEIVALPLSAGLPAYLDWVQEQTQP
jgi:periplasmic divalent cation tolerance protein